MYNDLNNMKTLRRKKVDGALPNRKRINRVCRAAGENGGLHRVQSLTFDKL